MPDAQTGSNFSVIKPHKVAQWSNVAMPPLSKKRKANLAKFKIDEVTAILGFNYEKRLELWPQNYKIIHPIEQRINASSLDRDQRLRI